ncbi:hypothetical protein J1614_000422 [Plenodomus biglobosus]|nr:hypothetical protein J1614_000422 [Plenodomus biglobosus]
MATHLPTPLRTAKGYYKRAWRIVLRAQHPRWKDPILKRRLAYLWASRTQADEDACEALRAAGSLMLPAVYLTIMPRRSVGRKWWPLRRGNGGAAGAWTVAPVPAQRVNTTSFAFWPQSGDINAPIPDSKDGLEKLFAAGTLLPGPDPVDGTWHGVTTIGEGATGLVYLFVKTDANNRIIDRMAVKDSKAMHRHNWVNSTYCRDNLPKEIAIQPRLASQGGAGITPFREYRLNMSERRHRQYFDYCDFHSMADLMVGYYYLHGSPAAQIAKKQRPNDLSLPALATIPEAFIWYVFQSLVDALTLFHDGTNQALPHNQAWKPITHLDICLSNVFASPAPKTDDATPLHPDYTSTTTTPANEKILSITQIHWPRLHLADFDTSIFSLQDTPETYQKQPPDSSDPDSSSLEAGSASRYAPELFHTFYVQAAAGALEPQPLGSATDIWALGQVLWCLLTNLTYGGDFRPRWECSVDDDDGNRVFINDEAMYTREELEKWVFADEGGSVAAGYSAELKAVVRDCLGWDPRGRPG